MSERAESEKGPEFQSILSRFRNSSFNLRVVVCRIRLFPTLISKIKWLGSGLPLKNWVKSIFGPRKRLDWWFHQWPSFFQSWSLKLECRWWRHQWAKKRRDCWTFYMSRFKTFEIWYQNVQDKCPVVYRYKNNGYCKDDPEQGAFKL